MLFLDRAEAGRLLAPEVGRSLESRPCRVYGLARGGVLVGREIAELLGAPLEVLVAVKIGAPRQPEVAVGAVAEGGGLHWEAQLIAELALDHEWRAAALRRAEEELLRRVVAYRGGPLPAPDPGEPVVVSDDGLATGSTMLAALEGLRGLGAQDRMVAAPVASLEALQSCRRSGARCVVLHVPAELGAVGLHYRDFHPVSDREVLGCLAPRATSA